MADSFDIVYSDRAQVLTDLNEHLTTATKMEQNKEQIAFLLNFVLQNLKSMP